MICDAGVSLDTAHCVACGICASVCPVEAVRHDAVERLVTTVCDSRPAESVTVGCTALSCVSDGLIALDGCLSAIGFDALLAVACAGVGPVRFVHGACARCEKGDHCRLFKKTLRDFRQTFPEMAALLQCDAAKNGGSSAKDTMSRRGMFSLFRVRPEERNPTVSNSVSACVSIPDSRRGRLQTLLRGLSCTGPVPDGVRNADIRIDASCTGCGACSRICPVGALEYETDDTGVSIRFAAVKCIDCGLCLSACRTDSLHRFPGSWEGVRETQPRCLYLGTLAVCKRCKAPSTVLVHGYCPVCAHVLGVTSS
nr:4Fe-4S binding protein [Pseudodesulfovibrio sp. JC047]